VASRVEEVPPELRHPAAVVPPVADRWPYPVEGLREGDWARHREGQAVVTRSVVGREGDGLWIESILEEEPRQASAVLVAPDGAVRKGYYCEITKGGKTAVSAQPVVQAGAAPAREAAVSKEAGEETVKVGVRELRCRSLRARFEDLDGRLREETTLFHPDVPRVRGGGEGGGLVRAPGVELLDFGRDAQPVVERPR
jgi:hypothetical protein